MYHDAPIVLSPARRAGESYRVTDDALLVNLYNSLASATFKLVARVLDDSGVLRVVQAPLTTTSDRTQQQTRIWLPSGQLVALSVQATAQSPRRGQSWAVVFLESTLPSGATTLTPLAQGYITVESALFWPGGPYGSSVEGPGMLRSVLGTDPAAGAEIIETVPTGARWKLHALRADLSTDATVPARTVNFYVDDGTSRLFDMGGVATQAASGTLTYMIGVYGYQPAQVWGGVLFDWPQGVVLFQAWRLRSATTNFVAGDNWAAPRMLVEEWIEA